MIDKYQIEIARTYSYFCFDFYRNIDKYLDYLCNFTDALAENVSPIDVQFLMRWNFVEERMP